MAKLTEKTRNALPSSEFALPGRRFPINDRAHAENAKSRAAQQENKGNLSPASAKRIIAMANRKLGK